MFKILGIVLFGFLFCISSTVGAHASFLIIMDEDYGSSMPTITGQNLHGFGQTHDTFGDDYWGGGLGDGFGGFQSFQGTDEEWMESCGYHWECSWALEDPEVMSQMLSGGAYQWSSTFQWGSGDITGECLSISVGTSSNARCNITWDIGNFKITGKDISHVLEPIGA